MRRLDLLDILKFIRYPLFFLVVFFVFLVILFPTDRFIPVLESKLEDALGRKVIIGDLSISVFGGIDLEDVQIEIPVDPKAQLSADDADEDDTSSEEEGAAPADSKKAEAAKPKRPMFYTIDEIEIDVGLVALLLGELSVDVELDIFDGSVSLSYEGPIPGRGEEKPDRAKLRTVTSEPKKEDPKTSAIPMKIRVEVEELSLAQVHELRDKLPIPAVGQISLAADLRSKTGKLTDLNGELGVVLENVILGEAGGQIEIGGMPLSLDPIVVSGMELAIEVDDGLAQFSEFVTRSPDVDLKLEGSMTFAEPFARSRFDFYLMFNILEGYTKKSDVANLLVTNLEQFSRDMKRAKRDDGYYGFRYRGMVRNWGSARFLASKTFGKRGGRKARPRKTVDRPERRSTSERRQPTRPRRNGLPADSPMGSGGGFPRTAPRGAGQATSPFSGIPEATAPAARPEKREVVGREVAEPPQEVVESEMEFDEEEVAEEEGDVSGGGEASTDEEEPGDVGEGASGDEEVETEE